MATTANLRCPLIFLSKAVLPVLTHLELTDLGHLQTESCNFSAREIVLSG